MAPVVHAEMDAHGGHEEPVLGVEASDANGLKEKGKMHSVSGPSAVVPPGNGGLRLANGITQSEMAAILG
jgi:hypothetical protein